MTRYVKFDGNGKAYAAPSSRHVDGGTLFGYDSVDNEAMLIADGWMRYDGDLPLSSLSFEDGEIVEAQNGGQGAALPTSFTKLQIRRCLRKYGYESVLDSLLESNEQFRKDWEDALNIDLDDEMMRDAVDRGLVPAEIIALVRNNCEPFDAL